ncbi:Alpha/Beta hydrolase protein [Bisporella sp. PMI_857]|nr:Alpha/Beta hydrolase protein [Bisporella sp. PMI_857]
MKSYLSILSLATSILNIAKCQTTSAFQALPTVDLGYTFHKASVNESGSYYNFTNIRYAQPPVGRLRFEHPVPPRTTNPTVDDGGLIPILCPQVFPEWTEISGALLGGANDSQLANLIRPLNISSYGTAPLGQSEDCLFLDVMVPSAVFDRRRQKRKAPVMVWIHGGGYAYGGKTSEQSSGNPAGLLRRSQEDDGEGIIYVAINYRLGLFVTNLGLYDQQLALKWVQDNIHTFGGDSSRVTVFGESAGGGSILHQITAYGAMGPRAPFSQAILQSPGFFPTATTAEEDTFHTTLGYARSITGRNITTVQDLRELTEDEIYRVNSVTISRSSYGKYPFGPAIDGKIVPKLPGELLAQGQFDKNVKIMVGQNEKESFVFTNPFVNSDAEFVDHVRSAFPGAPKAAIDHITHSLYPPVFDGSQSYTTQFGRVALMAAEVYFTCNNVYLDQAYENETYAYLFAVPPGHHGLDVLYTFWNDDIDKTTSLLMQRYFTNFAMTGSPNHNRSAIPYFPTYGSDSQLQLFNTKGLGIPVNDPTSKSRCNWWQKRLYQ